MSTFKKEISFISPTAFNQELNNGLGAFEEKEIQKTATFKELSRTDRDQHNLHFMIMGAFDSIKGKGVKYNTGAILEMTDEFIETSMLINDTSNPTVEITSADKTQFLNDSIAKLRFGKWLLDEKFAPFFAQLGSL